MSAFSPPSATSSIMGTCAAFPAFFPFITFIFIFFFWMNLADWAWSITLNWQLTTTAWRADPASRPPGLHPGWRTHKVLISWRTSEQLKHYICLIIHNPSFHYTTLVSRVGITGCHRLWCKLKVICLTVNKPSKISLKMMILSLFGCSAPLGVYIKMNRSSRREHLLTRLPVCWQRSGGILQNASKHDLIK